VYEGEKFMGDKFMVPSPRTKSRTKSKSKRSILDRITNLDLKPFRPTRQASIQQLVCQEEGSTNHQFTEEEEMQVMVDGHEADDKTKRSAPNNSVLDNPPTQPRRSCSFDSSTNKMIEPKTKAWSRRRKKTEWFVNKSEELKPPPKMT